MTRQDLEASTDRALDAWNAHDAARVAVRDNADPERRGRDAVRERAQMFMTGFPDLRIEVLTRCIEGNTACEEWRATGTHEGDLMGIAPTHRRTDNFGSTFIAFNDAGKVVREHIYWDSAKMLRDLGVLPEIAAAGATA